MKNKVIVAIISVIILIMFVVLIIFITTNNKTNSNINSEDDLSIDAAELQNEENNNKDKNEFKQIDIDSILAREIHNFLPKYYQIYEDKMSNDYIVFVSLCKLRENKIEPVSYKFGNQENLGYSFDLVNKTAKSIFGEETEIENIQKNERYKLPIEFSDESNAFYLYPVSIDTSSEYQVIKELKENAKSYILTAYALNIEHNINDMNIINVFTKETFKLYNNNKVSYEEIRKSTKQYKLEGIDADPNMIINEYKNDIPLIEYEIEKIDERGTEYFVKNIRLLLDK